MKIKDINGNVLYSGYFTDKNDDPLLSGQNVWRENTSTSLADCVVEAVVRKADLTRADLRGLRPLGALDLTGAKLAQADFTGAVFPGVVTLTDATIAGAKLLGSTWSSTPILTRTDLRGANMPMDVASFVCWASATYTTAKVAGWTYETATPLLP